MKNWCSIHFGLKEDESSKNIILMLSSVDGSSRLDIIGDSVWIFDKKLVFCRDLDFS